MDSSRIQRMKALLKELLGLLEQEQLYSKEMLTSSDKIPHLADGELKSSSLKRSYKIRFDFDLEDYVIDPD